MTLSRVCPPPFQKGGDRNFEHFKKGEPEKKLKGKNPKRGKDFRNEREEANFFS